MARSNCGRGRQFRTDCAYDINETYARGLQSQSIVIEVRDPLYRTRESDGVPVDGDGGCSTHSSPANVSLVSRNVDDPALGLETDPAIKKRVCPGALSDVIVVTRGRDKQRERKKN